MPVPVNPRRPKVPAVKQLHAPHATLHQPASLSLTKSSMTGDMLLPLFLMMGAFGTFYIAVLVLRLRAELLSAKIRNARLSQVAVSEATAAAE